MKTGVREPHTPRGHGQWRNPCPPRGHGRWRNPYPTGYVAAATCGHTAAAIEYTEKYEKTGTCLLDTTMESDIRDKI